MKKINYKKLLSLMLVICLGSFFTYRAWEKKHESESNPFIDLKNKFQDEKNENISNVFTFKGKSYSENDLPLDVQKEIFKEKLYYTSKVNSILNGLAVRIYEVQKSQPETSIDKAPPFYTLIDSNIPDEKVNEVYPKDRSNYPANLDEKQVKEQIKFKLISDKALNFYLKNLTEIYKSDLLTIKANNPTIPSGWLDVSDFPHIGSSDAKNRLIVFANYTCASCKNLNQEISDLYNFINPKEVEVVFVIYSSYFGPEEYSAKSAMCVYQHAKDNFWKFHIALIHEISNIDITDKINDKNRIDQINVKVSQILKSQKLDNAEIKNCIDKENKTLSDLYLKSKRSFNFLNIQQIPYFIFNNKNINLEARNLTLFLKKEKLNE